MAVLKGLIQVAFKSQLDINCTVMQGALTVASTLKTKLATKLVTS